MIYLPKKIRVGYQERTDTYTKRLAYVIYYRDGELRKQKSWESWRDEKIPANDFDNEPTEGFVLNKKAGGYNYGWNDCRQSWIRVYDPRGFEFEITPENLLFILEHANSIKGKGLEGDFVYAFDGKDLLLMPTSCPDYIELQELTNKVDNKEFLIGKQLEDGCTYLTKDNEEITFLTKDYYYSWNYSDDKSIKNGKVFWFAEHSSWSDHYFSTHYSSISKKIIRKVEKNERAYREGWESLKKNYSYSPMQEPVYCKLTSELIKEYPTILENFELVVYTDKQNKIVFRRYDNSYYISSYNNAYLRLENVPDFLTTGYDDDTIACILLARPTAILKLYLQIVGRGLRVNDTKKECLILDCANCVSKHGLVKDYRYYVPRKSKNNEPLYVCCPECGNIEPIHVKQCTICGYDLNIVIEQQKGKPQPKKQLEKLIRTYSLQDELYNKIRELVRDRGA